MDTPLEIFFLLLIEVLCLIFSSKFQGMVVDEDL